MTVFYILDGFPCVSENFILREILALKKSGLNLRICALRKSEMETVHKDALPLVEEVIYVEDIPILSKILAVAYNIYRHPAYCLSLFFHLFSDIFISFRFFCQRLRGAVNAMAVAKIAGTGPDHVHAHFAYVTSDMAKVLAGISGCRWSVSVHAWDIFTQPGNIISRRIEGADKVFVCSRHGKELLENLPCMCKEKIVLQYHGVSTGEFEASSEGQYIIAVGRLEEKKGFDILLQACRILADGKTCPRFIIVGEGPRRGLLEAKIKELGLENVELPGAMSFNKVKEMMSGAMMLVHPGRTTKNGDHDGIPNVILEAMALGKPVITSSVGGISEVIEDKVNGLIVRTEDQVQLAEAIRSVMNDKSLAEKLGNVAREHVRKNFELSETLKPMFEYFNEMKTDDRRQEL